eukprot:m.65395 g.65395  ORF g.65395 m.65395 type:complete len:292 (+) comp15916_c0_seq4:326-1201(+)
MAGAAFEQERKEERNLGRLWSLFVGEILLGLLMALLIWKHFCWSTAVLGAPLLFSLIFGVRVSCPGLGCMFLCPDAPVDPIELTKYFSKSLLGHSIYFLFTSVCYVISIMLSSRKRKQCGDSLCLENEFTEDDCDDACGCSEGTVIVLGMLAVAVAILSLVTTLIMRSASVRLGSVRRVTKFDRLPDLSSTDEEEDSEEDTARPDTGSGTTAAADGDLESAPAPSSVPGSMFSRLADALAAPGASTADSGKQGSTNANDDAAVPATFTVVSGSAEGSDDDFSEFMGPEKTD